MPEELNDNSEDSVDESRPLEVKVTNSPIKDVKWNDSKDDSEYDELTLTDEERDI